MRHLGMPSSRVHTALALLPSVFFSIALALAGLLLVRHWVPAELLRVTNAEVGNYLQTLGTIYAVLLAFVVYVVWNQYNETRELVEREANELMDLLRTAQGFGPEVREPILLELGGYIECVLDREWPALGHCDDAAFEGGSDVLDQLWRIITNYDPARECQRALYAEILARFNDLSDARSSRILAGRTRIPFALRLLLFAGAVMTVGSMYLFAIDSFAIHALMTGALAGAISHVIYIIWDLDDCFAGDWQVSRAPFERVQRYARRTEG